MDNTQTMLRAIINGQSAMKEELLSEIKKVDNKLDKVEKSLATRIDKVEKSLTKRIDNLGESLAYLEDDVPTKEEFDELDERVEKLEVGIASV